MSFVRYVVHVPGNWKGEFEFISETQAHWTSRSSVAIAAAKEAVTEYMHSVEPPYNRREALSDMGGKPIVYKLTVEKVPYK